MEPFSFQGLAFSVSISASLLRFTARLAIVFSRETNCHSRRGRSREAAFFFFANLPLCLCFAVMAIHISPPTQSFLLHAAFLIGNSGHGTDLSLVASRLAGVAVVTIRFAISATSGFATDRFTAMGRQRLPFFSLSAW